MTVPTEDTILAAIELFEKIGEVAFLSKFARGHSPKEFYLRHNGSVVPLKALWAAAHTPPITTGAFTTDQAKAGFKARGFVDWGQDQKAKNDALCDIDSDLVDTRISTTTTYVRDPRVRAAVMRRAAGKCEYCKAQGFSGINGVPYLEAHHIIRLADEGKDRRTNVIALCPNHHREAHFGVIRDDLERQMTAIIAQKEAMKKSSK